MADLVIGRYLIPGVGPKVVRREMIAISRGTVVVDVPSTRAAVRNLHATTHTEPIYFADGVLQLPGNMPAVPYVRLCLTNATLSAELRIKG